MSDVPGLIFSRPALAITTAKYGRKTAPRRKNHRNGLGVMTAAIKQAVLTIIEMK